MVEPTHKTCKCCLIEKPIDAFYKKQGVCRDCTREKHRVYARKHAEEIAARKKEWFSKNKESEIRRMKQWREDNKDARIEYAKKYAIENAEKEKQRRREYRARNRDALNARTKIWCQNNGEKRMEHRRRYGSARRIRAFSAGGFIDRSITLHGVLLRDNFTCHICNEPIPVDAPPRHRLSATIDHLFPVSFGGQHIWDNVAAAHFGCNSRMKTILQIP